MAGPVQLDSPRMPPEVEAELAAIRKDVVEAGVTLWLDAEWKLHATPASKLSASTRERLKVQRDRLIVELAVLEAYAWRGTAWSTVERVAITEAMPDDLFAKRDLALRDAMVATVDANVGAARDALARLIQVWRAAARHELGEEGDRTPPDDFPNHPPAKEKA